MSKEHKVEQGDCIASIGLKYGFFPDTVWDDPANASLKAERKDGNVLLPGDVVKIPELRPKTVACATGKQHAFRRKGVPETLRLQFLARGEPRAGLAYSLDIDGKVFRGETDDEGRIELLIPPDAKVGKLTLGENEKHTLALGHLDPVEVESGARQRLVNLGLLADADADADGYAVALKRFQLQQMLPASGALDQATRDKLLEIHGV
jgi:hypothetical protein